MLDEPDISACCLLVGSQAEPLTGTKQPYAHNNVKYRGYAVMQESQESDSTTFCGNKDPYRHKISNTIQRSC